MDFQNVNEIITELNKSNSNLAKIEALKKYKDNELFKRILLYTYNPFLKFNVTSKNCIKNSEIKSEYVYNDLFYLLNDLNERSITGHQAIGSVNTFIDDNLGFEELIYNIIDRNLKIRIDVKTINKVFKDLVPVFDVALANKFDNKITSKLDFKNKKYGLQRKLDGVRCLSKIKSLSSFSRKGKEFGTLAKLHEEIQIHLLNKFSNYVLDGEVCLIDEKGNENFNGIMKEITRKDYTIQNPKLIIFDLLTSNEFESRKGTRSYQERFDLLQTLPSSDCWEVIEMIPISSLEDIEKAFDIAKKKGWEGLILRDLTATYQGKRSNDILKIKGFYDGEYKVKSIEVGSFRVIENGTEVEEEVMTNVNITHKGFPVSVGSGFSLEERRHFYKNPNDLIGNIITVKYFEETTNKNGTISLRFPTCKFIHGRERKV